MDCLRFCLVSLTFVGVGLSDRVLLVGCLLACIVSLLVCVVCLFMCLVGCLFVCALACGVVSLCVFG